MMNATDALEDLEWDSEHFGIPVGRIAGGAVDDRQLADVLSAGRDRGTRLVYWSAPRDRSVPEPLLLSFGGLLADRKATFHTANLAPTGAGADVPVGWVVEPQPRGPASDRLHELASDAGRYSRFR